VALAELARSGPRQLGGDVHRPRHFVAGQVLARERRDLLAGQRRSRRPARSPGDSVISLSGGPGRGRILADKAHGSPANRHYLRRREIKATIPGQALAVMAT